MRSFWYLYCNPGCAVSQLRPLRSLCGGCTPYSQLTHSYCTPYSHKRPENPLIQVAVTKRGGLKTNTCRQTTLTTPAIISINSSRVSERWVNLRTEDFLYCEGGKNIYPKVNTLGSDIIVQSHPGKKVNIAMKY